MQAEPVYRRVLLKLSGEALAGENHYGINPEILRHLASEIQSVLDINVSLAVVIGGGNIFRGIAPAATGMDRVNADYMGMLATIINALALQDALRQVGITAHVQSALDMQVVERYDRNRALQYLENRQVVIFAAGTGNPFFTTDTAAALRAIEIKADIVLKATKVDGIYSDDPIKNKNAVKFDSLSAEEAITRHLKVMDATAFTLCRDHNMPICVFSLFRQGAIQRVLLGQDEGTRVLPGL